MQDQSEKMIAGRGFRVTIFLDVHAITCPGVWLCPHGKITLRITSLGRTLASRRVSPIFPLLLHQRLTFAKILAGTISLTMLQRNLEEELIYAELVQCLGPHEQAIVLATFQRNLTDLLYPTPSHKHLLPGVNIDLLMEPTAQFPGIIVPKIEISTSTVIEEVSAVFRKKTPGEWITKAKLPHPKRDESCGKRGITTGGTIRQKKVCHTKVPSNLGRQAAQRECTSTASCIKDRCCRMLGLSCPTCSRYNYYFEPRPRKMQPDRSPGNLARSWKPMSPANNASSQYIPCNCEAKIAYINCCGTCD